MTGRSGKRCRNSADRKGCADEETPAQDITPPFSSRRCRVCTAGVCATAANKPFASVRTESFAKRSQSRTTTEAASRGSADTVSMIRCGSGRYSARRGGQTDHIRCGSLPARTQQPFQRRRSGLLRFAGGRREVFHRSQGCRSWCRRRLRSSVLSFARAVRAARAAPCRLPGPVSRLRP